MIRVATVADGRFRDRAGNLARSLEASPNDYSLIIYCDDEARFADLRSPRCKVIELGEIRRLGAKRAKLTAFVSALREDSVIYLDADAIVLEDLGELWGGDEIRGCADDLLYCPFIQDRWRPWTGDPSLTNSCYINSGAFFAPAGRYPFFEHLRTASLDDELWRRYTLDGYLYDNHFLCAFLNLLNEPVRLLDPQVYGWRGFLRDGQLQVRRSGSHLVNRCSGKNLKLVLFAGAQQTAELLRSFPLEIATLLFERTACRGAALEDVLGSLYAALSHRMIAAPVDGFAADILQTLLAEVPGLARACSGEADLRGRSSYFTRPDAIKAMAFANPNPDATWNGLCCGGAYLDGEEYSHIRTMVRSLGIEKVLETGAGETSILFRKLGVESYSLEYQPGPWIERATQLGCVCLLGAFDHTEQRFAEPALQHQLTAHHLSQVDLLFIDSPVGTLSRRNVVSQLLEYVKPRFVLYHDALRDAVNLFRDAARYGWKLAHFLDTPRGMALFAVCPDDWSVSMPDAFDRNTVLSRVCAAVTILWSDRGILQPGQEFSVRIKVKNGADSTFSSRYTNPVLVSYHWFSRDGTVVIWDGLRTGLPFDLEPGDTAEFSVKVCAPQGDGDYSLRLAVVQEGVAWLDDASSGASLDIRVGVEDGDLKSRRGVANPYRSRAEPPTAEV